MIKKMLQGTLVGIGSILPGVSGGIIAAAFNIYTKLIEALDRFTKEPMKAIFSIWEYLVGIAIGIFVGFIGIAFVFYAIPIPLTLLFIGLIIGGAPEIYQASKVTKTDYKSWILPFVTVLLMIGLTFILPYFKQTDVSNTHFMVWIVVGMLLALSLIVPGLSGTMLMMMIGYYGPLLMMGKDLLTSLIDLNFDQIFRHGLSLVLVGLGMVIAFIALSKALNWTLNHFPKYFYQVILGIIIAAPINIMISLHEDLSTLDEPINIFDFSKEWSMWAIGLMLIPTGIFLARKFSGDANETEKD